jgi:tripartite-type tricarboxylate transporter receptor subunit TctC
MTSFRFVTALLVGFSIWEPAFAFPLADRPIKLIVPFAAGGSTDVMAREIGRRLSQRLSIPVIIENKSGGGTTIAAAEVSRAVPDGHTLLYTTLVTFALNPHLLKSRGYNAARFYSNHRHHHDQYRLAERKSP